MIITKNGELPKTTENRNNLLGRKVLVPGVYATVIAEDLKQKQE